MLVKRFMGLPPHQSITSFMRTNSTIVRSTAVWKTVEVIASTAGSSICSTVNSWRRDLSWEIWLLDLVGIEVVEVVPLQCQGDSLFSFAHECVLQRSSVIYTLNRPDTFQARRAGEG